MNNTVFYCRTANGGMGAIQAQINSLLFQTMESGFSPFEVYCDCYQSGSTLERPQLCNLLQSVQRGAVERIMVLDYARLSRNKIHLSELLDFFQAHDVQVVPLIPNYDIDEAKTHLTDILEDIEDTRIVKA